MHEETDESDSDSAQNLEMESHVSPQTELQEEAAEEAELRLKNCSVLLNRLGADDKAAKKELDEKEEMNRKGGKPVSRIPTFHKRPTELTKKDPPTQVPQPPEKAAATVTEPSKSKTAEVKERSLPVPSVRSPFVGSDASSSLTSTEQTATTHSSYITTPKSWSLSDSLMSASPRPALRAERGSVEQPLPEQHKSKTAEVVDDPGVACVPQEQSSTVEQQGEPERKNFETRSRSVVVSPSGDAGDLEDVEIVEPAVEAITDEQPPWEKEPTNLEVREDSGSSTEPDSEDGLWDSEEKTQDSQAQLSHTEEKKADTDESATLETEETPVQSPSPKSTKRSSSCFSCSLFCFLPTVLLLLGGFGQHVWHYGVPMSVAQLSAQMNLHWLEGFGLQPAPCSTDCRVHLVESIPVGLYPSAPSPRQSIADSWLRLLDKANYSVNIAAFYVTLRSSDSEVSDAQGRMVFEKLKNLKSKGVHLQVAVNGPQTSTQDTAELAAAGGVVREVDLKAVTGGIIHTKLWVVDHKHLYVGSANMDWRSLSQVKEAGLSVEDCGCLAQDVSRIFEVYWTLGGATNGSLPPYWPARLSALSSSQNPLHLKFNGVPARVYLSSAPLQISARGRSDDLATILSVIEDAQRFVHVSVMDFLPQSEFSEPHRFWPAIDSALRAAACSGAVQVRLLVSCWPHSRGSMFLFLQSLLVLNRPPLNCDIEVKVFAVPSTPEQRKIPFARVNHAKFMVTDRVVYIGTSNWSRDYFTSTAGVGLVVNQTGSAVGAGQETLQSQTEGLFLRDWTSQYATSLTVDQTDACPQAQN